MKGNILLILLQAVILGLGLSCSFSGSAPEILWVSITQDQKIIDVSCFDRIEINFSRPMNRYVTEKNIIISGYYGTVHYQWDRQSTHVDLVLEEPLEKGMEYTLVIGKGCESGQGVDIGADTRYNFFTYKVDGKFYVKSTFPKDGQQVSGLNELVVKIDFSLPADYTTIYDKLSFGPEVPYRYWFSADRKQLLVALSSPLEPNRSYTVNIEKDLGAYQGKCMEEDYAFSFNTIFNTRSFYINSAVMKNDQETVVLDTGYLRETQNVQKDMH
ncbi:MAG: Ig-like domain-containing protein, partial [Spirochaetota bacterium]